MYGDDLFFTDLSYRERFLSQIPKRNKFTTTEHIFFLWEHDFYIIALDGQLVFDFPVVYEHESIKVQSLPIIDYVRNLSIRDGLVRYRNQVVGVCELDIISTHIEYFLGRLFVDEHKMKHVFFSPHGYMLIYE